MARIFYQKTQGMEARDGNKFATTYYKQTLEQRKQLTKHIRACTKEIIDYLDKNPSQLEWHMNTPLKGFPKTKGQPNRTTWEILTDMVNEAKGRKRDGTPKDYAQAPIDRWNKLFAGTDYEIVMEQRDGLIKTTFDDLWKIED